MMLLNRRSPTTPGEQQSVVHRESVTRRAHNIACDVDSRKMAVRRPRLRPAARRVLSVRFRPRAPSALRRIRRRPPPRPPVARWSWYESEVFWRSVPHAPQVVTMRRPHNPQPEARRCNLHILAIPPVSHRRPILPRRIACTTRSEHCENAPPDIRSGCSLRSTRRIASMLSRAIAHGRMEPRRPERRKPLHVRCFATHVISHPPRWWRRSSCAAPLHPSTCEHCSPRL